MSTDPAAEIEQPDRRRAAYQKWYSPPFETFIRPAYASPSIGRVGLALFAGVAIYLVGTLVLILVAGFWLFDSGGGLIALVRNTNRQLIPMIETGHTPLAMGLMLASFIPMALAGWSMALWHRRGLRSLLGPSTGWLTYALIGLVVMIGLKLPFLALFFLQGTELATQQFALTTWLLHLLWIVPLVLIQCGAEELIFRGYLQQQLAVRYRHPAMWMLLPSVIFGLCHISPGLSGANTIYYIIWATVFGLILADLTRITGNLGAAIGMHLANNLLALIWIARPEEFSGIALFLLPATTENTQSPLLLDLFFLLVAWVVARSWLIAIPRNAH